jgi:hypothetical protein
MTQILCLAQHSATFVGLRFGIGKIGNLDEGQIAGIKEVLCLPICLHVYRTH